MLLLGAIDIVKSVYCCGHSTSIDSTPTTSICTTHKLHSKGIQFRNIFTLKEQETKTVVFSGFFNLERLSLTMLKKAMEKRFTTKIDSL